MTSRRRSEENDALISAGDDPGDDSCNKPEPGGKPRKRRKYVVEVLLCLYVIAGMPMMSIKSQFMYKMVQASMGVTLNETSSANCVVNLSDPNYILQQKVQAEAADWNMYLSLAGFLPRLIMTIFFGIYSDRLGRRITFILPPIGSIITTLLYIAVLSLKLPMWTLYFENIEYLFGGMMTLLMGAFSYISDTCEPEKRAWRMTVLESLAMMLGAVGELVVGYLIDALGFQPPLYFVALGKIATLIYAIFFIPESLEDAVDTTPSATKLEEKKENATERGLTWAHVKDGFLLYIKDDGHGRRWKLNVLLFAYLIAETFSTYRVMTLYEMDSPLCWGPILIGYFSACTMMIKCVMSLISAYGMRRCNISEAWIAALARVMSVAEYLYLGFVTTTVMMFFAPALGCITFIAIPMTRALMSKLVANNQQGALFAVMTTGSSITGLISTLSVNKIYAATLLFYKGFVFFFAAGMLSISLVLIMIFIMLSPDIRKPKFAQRRKGLSIQA